MMRTSILGTVVALAWAAAVHLPAQQASPPPPPPQEPQVPVFRSAADVVPITVRVVDQKGKPVTDLAQKDFRIYEDDRLRNIVGFYPQTMAPGPVVPPAVVWDRRNDNRLAAATRRTFVIVLGTSRMLKPDDAFDAAITFVTEKLLPQDAVSLIALHRATPFTTDHEAIAEVIARFKKHQERLIFDVRHYYGRSTVPYNIRRPFDIERDLMLPKGTPSIPRKILDDIDQSLFDGVFPTSELHNVADMLLGMDLSPETLRDRPAVHGPADRRPYQVQYTFDEMIEGLKRQGSTVPDAVLQSAPLRLFAGIEYLRFMDGEKHLVFFGGSPPIARDADIADVFAARANDARVIVDYIWSGLCLPCRDLVEATGGFFSSVDTAAEALGKLDERTRTSYLIGYEPSNPDLDDRYRRVRVEVDRPNVTVLYHDGYFASEDVSPADLKEKVARTRTNSALASDANATGLSVRANVELEQFTGTSRTVRVDLIIDMNSVGFEKDGDRQVAELHVGVYCGDAKEKVIGQSVERWTLRAGDYTLTEWLRDGMDRSVRLAVPEIPKYVKVVVYDPVSDRTGSISVKLK
jgi:hypothetical protein